MFERLRWFFFQFYLVYLFRFHQDKTGLRSTAAGCSSRMSSKSRITIIIKLRRLIIILLSNALGFQFL